MNYDEVHYDDIYYNIYMVNLTCIFPCMVRSETVTENSVFFHYIESLININFRYSGQVQVQVVILRTYMTLS